MAHDHALEPPLRGRGVERGDRTPNLPPGAADVERAGKVGRPHERAAARLSATNTTGVGYEPSSDTQPIWRLKAPLCLFVRLVAGWVLHQSFLCWVTSFRALGMQSMLPSGTLSVHHSATHAVRPPPP